MASVLAATGATAMAETGSAPATPQVPDLRADVNRDGRVDVEGTTDSAGENTWTATRGAVVLPNVDDDAKRCPVKDAQGQPLTDAKLARCNDASDTKVNGTRDAADLARLKTVPLPKTPPEATAPPRRSAPAPRSPASSSSATVAGPCCGPPTSSPPRSCATASSWASRRPMWCATRPNGTET
ncbi:peptidylarginine deiminase type I [Streptomyces alboflavus]|uniref:Peptidylarginine deiminase type I n=1 Tax=Streptomyces alboflavus TaxID=67267 RepID=A0A1Z1WRA2_9ACTN|nr:peptidylarginine deiminase type I [Streptomyces alboflavus]